MLAVAARLWGFGPDKQRTYEVTSKATTTNGTTFNPLTMTWFASPGHFEVDEEKDANGNWKLNECRHTIGSPEGNIGLVVTNCSNHSQSSDFTDRYYLKDHLGSNAGTFKQNALESRATYDVWGMRIESGNTDYDGMDSSNRGYTGHEHLTTFGLIHMNGRIYDPLLGRFLQADPIIDEPFNLQSYNRYAYVGNNPLAFTDPTGYSKWNRIRDRVIKPIAIAVIAYYTGQFVGNWITASGTVTSSSATVSTVVEGVGAVTNTATATSVSSSTISLAGAGSGAAAGFAAGGLQGGNLNSALQGAVTGGIAGGVSGFFGNNMSLQRVAAESLVGGVNARIGGGKFGHGFKFALALSGLSYGNHLMRQNQIANASLNLDGVNIDGESSGMNGDNKKLAGARRTMVRNPDTGLLEYGRCTSLMGGCQGAPIRQDDVRSSFFGFKYDAGSWQDRINESFAGPHDWFRNLTGSYDATGNSRNFTGLRAFVDDYIMNYGLVIPAAPFAAAALTPSYLYEPLRRR